MSKYVKPNWYPEEDVKATKSGWVYTKNHDEVLSAIGYLDEKIAAEEVVDPEPEPEVPEGENPEVPEE